MNNKCPYCGKSIYKNNYKYDDVYCCISHALKKQNSGWENHSVDYSKLDKLTPLEALKECTYAYDVDDSKFDMYEFEKDNCFKKIITSKAVINKFIKNRYALNILNVERFKTLIELLNGDKEKITQLVDNIKYNELEYMIGFIDDEFVKSLYVIRKLSLVN